MRVLILMILCSFVLLGCAKKEESGVSPSSADVQHGEKNQLMAYEHRIDLDADEKDVVSLHKSAESACINDVEYGCEILESSLDASINGSSAHLKMRAKPIGIQKITTSLRASGKVTHQSLMGEDLAEPIADSSKKIEMLKDYRAKLEDIRRKPGIDIDSLIKVNKELAEVQSNIEELTGKNTHLMKRVNTEVLSVFISSPRENVFFRPIVESFKSFKANLATAISSVITAFAFLLPWLIFIGISWVVIKKIRVYFKRK